MRLKLALLLAISAAFLGVSAGSALAVAPYVQSIGVPTYSGGDGTGTWTTHYKWRLDDPQAQVRAWSYLYVPDLNLRIRERVTYDPFSDPEIITGGATYVDVPGIASNTPSNCRYHGFHWFGTTLMWQERHVIGGNGYITNPGATWSSWTSHVEPTGPGVYAQVCL